MGNLTPEEAANLARLLLTIARLAHDDDQAELRRHIEDSGVIAAWVRLDAKARNIAWIIIVAAAVGSDITTLKKALSPFVRYLADSLEPNAARQRIRTSDAGYIVTGDHADAGGYRLTWRQDSVHAPAALDCTCERAIGTGSFVDRPGMCSHVMLVVAYLCYTAERWDVLAWMLEEVLGR